VHYLLCYSALARRPCQEVSGHYVAGIDPIVSVITI